jgi:hypothetical protein
MAGSLCREAACGGGGGGGDDLTCKSYWNPGKL